MRKNLNINLRNQGNNEEKNIELKSNKNSNNKIFKKTQLIILTILITASTILAGCNTGTNTVSTTETTVSSEVSNSDTSVNTQDTSSTNTKNANLKDDYYASVNADILKEKDAEKTGGWSYFQDMDDKGIENQKSILKDLQSKINSLDKSSSEYKLAKLYEMGLDTASRDKESLEYFNNVMSSLMSASTVEVLLTESAKIQKNYDMKGIINTAVNISDEKQSEYSMSLSELNFFVDAEDLTLTEVEEDNKYYFEDYLSGLLVLTGVNKETADKNVKSMQAMLTEIAKVKKDSEYKEVSVAELDNSLKNIDLNSYLSNQVNTIPSSITVTETETIKKLDEYMINENLEMLKYYVYLSNLEKFAAYLGSDIRNAKEKMEEEYIGEGETKAIESSVVNQVNESLKWDMGKVYADRYYDSETENYALEMTNKIISEFEIIINEKTWLSSETKKKAIEKLHNIQLRIGVPKDIERYVTKVSIDSNKGYFGNILELRKEYYKEYYNSYGENVDRTRWDVAPQELQPSYYPNNNSINIPAVTFQSPYFDKNASYETNLGALGVTIAHEITHAFDDLGSQYDKHGDLVNWWTDSDRAEFDKLKQNVVDYYNNYKTPDTIQTDGQQTVGENIADLGAVNATSRIIKKENLDGKKFFESYANIWASTQNGITESIMAGMDEHASDKVRTNAVLSSNDLFYETYDIKEGDGMYIAPDKRVGIW